ncbi:hypothetical protein ACWDKQ_20585 [Saccharopolyspora sp. NPDC000995]
MACTCDGQVVECSDVTAGARPGEGLQLFVQQRINEPVGQGGHRAGTDAKDHFERVPGRVSVRQECLQRTGFHCSGLLRHLEREHPDRLQAGVAERLPGAQCRDDHEARAHLGQHRGVRRDAEVALVAGGDREDNDFAGHRIQRGRLEHRA